MNIFAHVLNGICSFLYLFEKDRTGSFGREQGLRHSQSPVVRDRNLISGLKSEMLKFRSCQLALVFGQMK